MAQVFHYIFTELPLWIVVLAILGIIGIVATVISAVATNKSSNDCMSGLKKSGFVPDKIIYNDDDTSFFAVNYDNKKFCIYNIKDKRALIFDFAALVDYEIVEMKKTFVQGTEGRAFLGALLFGPIGAIIGASGDREIYEVLSGITFKFILSDKNTPSFLFKITSEVISCDSSDFDIIKEKVFNLETILKKIIISSANTERLLYGKSQKPLREQLSELKSLYDEGLISKDVYDDAQKNLLRS